VALTSLPLIYSEGYDAVVPATQVRFLKAPLKTPTLTLSEFVIIETPSVAAHVDTLGSVRPTIVCEVNKSRPLKADFRLGEIPPIVESNRWNL
jgi:hypothetical protein